ncbi:hypothetical protein ARHIZOSPH14_13940 [Agromyces rhizosphaerae]|uniref:Alpha/beta hydrolase n=1 Tax=Agromyces rhizosphaerae TaxID=88374 RepID=A0A9W6FR00_9MICO|nr:hypothetical protein [Agromyces rhizosphaerae]GLI27152.1 hypothetical protein ARHIZOSPH14_13940 [Agromyces rhizosphaerae]
MIGPEAGRRLSPLAKWWWWSLDYVYAGWRQAALLWDGRRAPRRWLRGDPALPEVVLLPGIYEHWSFVRPMGDALNRAGHRVLAVHGMGANRADIAETSARLARALGRRRTPDAGRVIVGHSKGGLIGKHLLVHDLAAAGRSGAGRSGAGRSGAGRADAPGDRGPLGIIGVVGIATPFGGSTRAWLLQQDPSIRALRPDDPVIAALRSAASVNAHIASIHPVWDPHVPNGSVLAGAHNVEVPVAGHFLVMRAPATVDAVRDAIGRLAASAAPSRSG